MRLRIITYLQHIQIITRTPRKDLYNMQRGSARYIRTLTLTTNSRCPGALPTSTRTTPLPPLPFLSTSDQPLCTRNENTPTVFLTHSAGEWDYLSSHHGLVLGTRLHGSPAIHGRLPAGYGPTAQAVRYHSCAWYYYHGTH